MLVDVVRWSVDGGGVLCGGRGEKSGTSQTPHGPRQRAQATAKEKQRMGALELLAVATRSPRTISSRYSTSGWPVPSPPIASQHYCMNRDEAAEGEKEKGDENAEGEEEPEEEEVEEEPVLRDKVRIIFCETTMVVFIIAEASALVVSTSFWLLMHANPAKPGSYAIPVSQTIINFFVMIVGECIVTDGIIAILSHHLTSRFKVDLPATWKHMKQYKSKMLVAIVATISLNSFVVLAPVGTTLCFTHRVDTTVEELVVEVEDLVMTSCPEPPENVTQFDLVGRMFYEQWSKYYYSD